MVVAARRAQNRFTLAQAWQALAELESRVEEVAPAPQSPNPPPAPVVAMGGLENGRGGRPHLVSSMRYVLSLYGPLHPTDIARKIEENGLAPNSSNLVDYIRYTLSKNKSAFAKVPGQRGMWQVVESSSGLEEILDLALSDESSDSEPEAPSEKGTAEEAILAQIRVLLSTKPRSPLELAQAVAYEGLPPVRVLADVILVYLEDHPELFQKVAQSPLWAKRLSV